MSNDFSKYLFKYSEPLNKFDTEEQTYGCRAVNPDNCKNCMTQNICAFVRKDHICKYPSRQWKKYYISKLESSNTK